MFYQKSIQDILKECESSLKGLNDFQVKKHSAKYGKNELIEKKKDSPLVIFLKQFQDQRTGVKLHPDSGCQQDDRGAKQTFFLHRAV